MLHVIPINDLKDHSEDSICECNPKAEILENGDMLIIHNSYDGREIVENIIDEIFNN
jgi:hypothetical protein